MLDIFNKMALVGFGANLGLLAAGIISKDMTLAMAGGTGLGFTTVTLSAIQEANRSTVPATISATRQP